MRKYLPGIGLVTLAVFLFAGTLLEVGQLGGDRWWRDVLFVSGYQIVLAYCVIGAGLVGYVWWSETPRLTVRAGAVIGVIAIASVSLAWTYHPAIGEGNPGAELDVFYVVLVAVLLFVWGTIRSRRHALLLVAVAGVPPVLGVMRYQARMATAGPANDGFGTGFVVLIYCIAFLSGVLYGLPFLVAGAVLRHPGLSFGVES